LLSLGLGEPSTKPAKSAESLKKLQQSAAKKRKAQDKSAFKPDLLEVEDEKEAEKDTPQRKRPSLASVVASPSASDGSLLRRSSRSVRAIKRLADEVFAHAPEDDFEDEERTSRKRNGGEPLRKAKSLGKRIHDPCVFDHVAALSGHSS
jgi:hypothetical protein